METGRARFSWSRKSSIISSATRRPLGGRSGFTLLEVMIASGILVGMFAVAMAVVSEATDLYKTTTITGNLNMTSRRCMERIVRDLRYSGTGSDGWDFPEGVAVTQASFSRCVGYDTVTGLQLWGEVITYRWDIDPGEIEDGIDNDNDGLVDEGTLSRQLASGSSSVIAQDVERAGFVLSRNGLTVTLRLMLARRDRQHRSSIIRGGSETTIVLRN